MFFAMTPEMIKNLNDLKKKAPNVKAPNVKAPNVKAPNVKAPMSFEAYYNKRFLEECKYFIENPKFSMKYAIVMSYLQKDIREKALKEYKEKWPGSPIEQSKDKNKITHQVKLVNNSHTEKSQDTESVISDYDIIEEDDIIDEDDVDSVHSDQSVNSDQSVSEELNSEPQPNLRRSKRLLKKSN